MKVLAEAGAPNSSPVVVAISPTGEDVGLLYTEGLGSTFFFHHVGHYDLRHEVPKASYRWVSPSLSDDLLQDVLAVTVLLVDRYSERGDGLPFGFGLGATFDRDGALRITPQDAGFSCATFVAAVFHRADLPLVDLATWATPTDKRRREDRHAQLKLIDSLETDSVIHAALLRSRMAPARLRPEEVAAASGMSPLPLDLDRAEAAGLLLNAELVSL